MYFGILLISALNGFNAVQADDGEMLKITIFKPHEKGFQRNISERNHRKHLKSFQEETYRDLSSCGRCGLSNDPEYSPMIVNGSIVDPPYKYPWMVAMIDRESEQKFCGGVLLNEYFILSAAHCFEKNEDDLIFSQANNGKEYKSPNQIAVAFVTRTDEVEPGPPVEAIIPHSKYTSAGSKYDIALLKLSLKLTCSKFRSPICLPNSNFRARTGATFTATGWGSEGGGKRGGTKNLREAKIKRVNLNVCRDKFPRNLKIYGYCLVGVQDQGPCKGDSGGPMFSKYHGKYYVLGIASAHVDAGTYECNPEKPFVYTAVPEHIQWIKEVMRSPFPKVPRLLGGKKMSTLHIPLMAT